MEKKKKTDHMAKSDFTQPYTFTTKTGMFKRQDTLGIYLRNGSLKHLSKLGVSWENCIWKDQQLSSLQKIGTGLHSINGSQLAKMKKSIPHMSLP